MSFLHPGALVWALLAIPVVIFYILKIRLKRVPVSTVIFWRQIFDEKKPQSIWQRLRHLVSLLVQLFLLSLLVFSLAEPFLTSDSKNARRLVLVIDNSASMKATDGDPTRLTRAKEEALAVIRGLRFTDEMAVLSAGTQPTVVCGITGHQKTLREAIDSIPATDGPTHLAEAIAAAKRLGEEENSKEGSSTSSGKETEIVVITDGGTPDFAKLQTSDKIKFIVVGAKTPNVAITRFQTRRSAIDPIGYEILVEVTNQSDEESGPIRLAIKLNDNLIEIKPLNLKPNEKWSEVIENTTADGGLLIAELVTKGEKEDVPLVDALAADNVARAVLPVRLPQPTHMHSPSGNLFLQRVLEANPLVQLTQSKEMPKSFAAGGITVFHREVPAKLPPGQILVVDPASDCDLWTVGEKLQSPIVTQQEKESPLMAHVRLDNILMPEAKKLTFTQAAGKPTVLAGAVSGDPLYALIERPEGKVLVLTVHLEMGDLPFRTAFPILAMNALNFFNGGQGELRESLATGSTTSVTLANEATLKAPDGTEKQLPAGKLTVGPFDQVGVWTIDKDQYAVNLMNAAESDLRAPEDYPSSAHAAGLVAGFLGRPVWYYLIAFAWAMAALEWYLYQRRWIS